MCGDPDIAAVMATGTWASLPLLSEHESEPNCPQRGSQVGSDSHHDRRARKTQLPLTITAAMLGQRNCVSLLLNKNDLAALLGYNQQQGVSSTSSNTALPMTLHESSNTRSTGI